MAGRGGARPGAGRKPGSKTRVQMDGIKLAQEFAPEAMRTLAQIMRDPKAPAAARVTASENIVNRAFGRPHQSVGITDDTAKTKLHEYDLSKMTDEQLEAVATLAALGEAEDEDEEDNGEG